MNDHEKMLSSCYKNVLLTYSDSLGHALDLIKTELDKLADLERENFSVRFHVRHGLLDFADTIVKTDHALELLGNNFTWSE